jgi:hypothetical protein
LSFDLKIIDGDLVLQNGDFRQVQDTEKLIQDILKICLTEVGSNPLLPWYGSYLSRSVIGSALGTNVTVQLAQTQLQNALQNLMTVQQQQVKSFQMVTPDELINSISGISVSQSASNPTLFLVQVAVLTKGFKPVTTAFTVSTI